MSGSSVPARDPDEDLDLAGDVVLHCADGEHVRAFRVLLRLVSPVFRELLAVPEAPEVLQVDGSKEAWEYILSLIHPTFPRPKLTLESAYLVLPLAQRYKVLNVLAEANVYLAQHLPPSFSSNPDSPSYLFRWLKLADDHQLGELKHLCLRKVRDMAMARSKRLELALVAADGQSVAQRTRPRTCPGRRPQGSFPNCPSRQTPAHVPATSSTSSSTAPTACRSQPRGNQDPSQPECPAWCRKCRVWVCPFTPRHPGVCSRCLQPLSRSLPWFPSDEPQVQGAIRGLSHGAKEELLANLVVGFVGDCNKEEPSLGS